MKKILIYGDSNVWGDNFFTGVRIPDDKQWAKILQKNIGDEYLILQEGLPGRLAGEEEQEKKYKNGKSTFLATFRSMAPIDYLIIALGTNDLQIKYDKSSSKIVDDLLWYTKILESEIEDEDNKKKFFVRGQLPKILYILPTHFDYQNRENNIFDVSSETKRKEIYEEFSRLKNKYLYDETLPLFEDGIHLNYDGHQKLAVLVLEYLKANS